MEFERKRLPSQKYLKECFDYDSKTGNLYWKERPIEHFKTERAWKIWNKQFPSKLALNYIHKNGYKTGAISGEMVYAHRVIYKLITGDEPDIIDHEGRDKTDNRIENLISGTFSKNSKNLNMSLRNKSGVTGVSWSEERGKWVAQIRHEGKTTNLGRFVDFNEAVKARKSAEVKLNFHPNHGKNKE
ncbi:AP2 domain protein [compost metagenome]